MTSDGDIERLVGHWLDDGPTRMPDRVIDVMADRIERQRQRPAWRLLLKDLTMQSPFRAAAIVAAVLVIAVGAIVILRPSSSNGPGGVGPPSAAPPSASPTASSIASRQFRPAVRVDAPFGWTVNEDARTFNLVPGDGVSVAGAAIGLMSGPFATFKDHSCNDQAPAAVGTSVSAALASLTGDPRVVATAPQTITIDGRAGQMVDLRVAPTWTGTCDWSAGKGAVIIVSATTTGPAFGTGGSGRDRYIFLDVGGSVVAIDLGTPTDADHEAFLAEAMPIVESIRFP
jgi:hypothetical protein